MKKEFFDYLIEKMQKNPDVYFISIGLGWPRTNELKQFGDRYIQTEAAEQTALDIAVGIAYSGKIPVVYTITPFFLRGFETIRTYISHERLSVIMVGAGRNDDYSRDDGFSHDATDIRTILLALPNISLRFPNGTDELQTDIDFSLIEKDPCFISLRR